MEPIKRLVQINLSIPEDLKHAAKIYAVENRTTITDLVCAGLAKEIGFPGPFAKRADRLEGRGSIYLARIGSQHKIGKAHDVGRRLQHLSRETKKQIELIHEIPCAEPLKAELSAHGIFRKYHVVGDYFQLPKRAIQEFKKLNEAKLIRLVKELVGPWNEMEPSAAI